LPGLKAFVAAVLGGIGNIPGAALGGFLLGIDRDLRQRQPLFHLHGCHRLRRLDFDFAFRPAGLLGKFQVEKV
jgi:branched-chain amino acid transport system permease protein